MFGFYYFHLTFGIWLLMQFLFTLTITGQLYVMTFDNCHHSPFCHYQIVIKSILLNVRSLLQKSLELQCTEWCKNSSINARLCEQTLSYTQNKISKEYQLKNEHVFCQVRRHGWISSIPKYASFGQTSSCLNTTKVHRLTCSRGMI